MQTLSSGTILQTRILLPHSPPSPLTSLPYLPLPSTPSPYTFPPLNLPSLTHYFHSLSPPLSHLPFPSLIQSLHSHSLSSLSLPHPFLLPLPHIFPLTLSPVPPSLLFLSLHPSSLCFLSPHSPHYHVPPSRLLLFLDLRDLAPLPPPRQVINKSNLP